MKAVVFDLDGTLVDLFEVHLAGFQEVARRDFGLEFERADLEGLYGRTAADIARRFFEKHSVEGVDYEDFTRKRREAVIASLGSCNLLPGARELLEGFHDLGIPLAVATSNHTQTGEAIVDACGIRKFFSALVYKQEGLRSKPHPDLFEEAARRLDVPNASCAAVEDSVFGVKAALAAGMAVCAVSTGTHGRTELEDVGPHILVDSLENLSPEDILGIIGSSP